MTIKLSFKLIPALGAVNVVKNIPLGEKRMRHHVRLRVTKLIASPSWLFAWLMAWAVLCALTCSAWGGSKTQQVHDPDRVPEGLTAADWNNIRAVHEEQRYALAPSGSGYRAHNPGHQWQTEFDGDGFLIQPEKGDWRWGLELDSYGFPGHEQVVGKAHNRKVEGQRIIYDREENVSEWFVNNQRGLEHGFTIGKRPDGSAENKDPLRFTFSVLGSLRPVISSDGDAVRFVDASGSAVVTYAGLEVWDSDGRSLPAHFVKSEKGIGLIVDECDGRYPITIDPIAQQVYLKASNTGQVGISDGDLFGESVAISGDTAVVGARGESSAATGVNGDQSNNAAVEAGAAYVFVRSGGTWIQQAYLKASNTGALDNFGISVAISGDTLVVGAEKENSAATGVNGDQANNNAKFSGAAYVFVRSGGTWRQQAYLKASNTGARDFFGVSVAISGGTVVVGAHGEGSSATGVNGNQSNNSAIGSGAAYVFTRTGTNWAQQAYLKASNTQASDLFGVSVAISGNTAVVGAYGEDSAAVGVNGNQNDNSAPSSGAAYVFVRSGGTWAQQAYLKASNTGAGDFFGWRMSVAISGDTAIVGARQESSAATRVNGVQNDNSASHSGAAYVFVRTGTSWAQQAYLKASNTQANDLFGSSVAISGNTAVVGAYGEDSAAVGVNGNQNDNSAPGAGAAYVFVRSGGTWSQRAYFKASNTGAGDNFGIGVAISADTALIGAWAEDSSATGVNGNQNDNSFTNSGAVYVFNGLPATARLETEALKVQAVSPVPSGYSTAQWYGVFNAAAASHGAGTYFNANAIGNYITYTVPVAKPGTYDLRVGIQTKPNKGIWRLAINGLNIGQPQDEYYPSVSYGVRDLGAATFSVAGNYAFKFTVAGKNASSTGYTLAFDYIELVPNQP